MAARVFDATLSFCCFGPAGLLGRGILPPFPCVSCIAGDSAPADAEKGMEVGFSDVDDEDVACVACCNPDDAVLCFFFRFSTATNTSA